MFLFSCLSVVVVDDVNAAGVAIRNSSANVYPDAPGLPLRLVGRVSDRDKCPFEGFAFVVRRKLRPGFDGCADLVKGVCSAHAHGVVPFVFS